MKGRVVGHWKTSVGGPLLAVLLWWQTIGFKIPETPQEWAATVGSALITALGLLAPDHREPPAAEEPPAP